MTELGIYVYGLVPDHTLADAPDLPGIDGEHAVECVRHGKVCALVSKVSLGQFEEHLLHEHLADMAWVEQTARRHQQVLDAVLDRCTPLPMRLCTLYSDEDGLRQMLASREQDLSTALSELDGKLEWGVQVFAGPRSPDPSEAATEAALSGTSYLQQKLAGRRARERADADLHAVCDRLHAQLCAIALAGRLGMPQRPEVSGRELPMILNASYLLPNYSYDRFAERVGELREELDEQGLQLQMTGPWPPYNFVTTALGAAA